MLLLYHFFFLLVVLHFSQELSSGGLIRSAIAGKGEKAYRLTDSILLSWAKNVTDGSNNMLIDFTGKMGQDSLCIIIQ